MPKRQAGEVAAAGSGHQVRHENRIAAIQFESVDLLAGDVILHRRRFGLQFAAAAVTSTVSVAAPTVSVAFTVRARARVELVVGLSNFLNPDASTVIVYIRGRDVRDDVVAGFVGRSPAVPDRSGS